MALHVTRWFRKHPIAGFLLLAFAITYLIGVPVAMAGWAWAPTEPLVLRNYLPRVLVVYGPGLAAILMASMTYGRTGAAALLRRLVPRPSDLAWALVVMLVGAVSSGLALANAGVPAAHFAQAIDAAGTLLAWHFALQMLVVAAGEEMGWRGWLLPRLLERTSRLRAAVIVGAVWGLWHGPLLLSGLRTSLLFLLSVLGLSLLFTWIWSRTGERLFVVIVAHATVNAPLFFWEELARQQNWSGQSAPAAWLALESMYALVGCGSVLLARHWWHQRIAPAMLVTNGETDRSEGLNTGSMRPLGPPPSLD